MAELRFSWSRLRGIGIGYAMAEAAKVNADAVLDAGEDAGLALACLQSGAKRVEFSGPEPVARKLAEIAVQLGVEFARDTDLKPNKALSRADERSEDPEGAG